MPASYIHDPWNMPRGLRKQLKLTIGDSPEPGCTQSYPQPVQIKKYTAPDAMLKLNAGNE